MFRTLLLSSRRIYIGSGTRRLSSNNNRSYKDVEIKMPWGCVAGKWWEPYDTRPILTVHGWQDNCGSFDRIIPMLSKDVGFLAIDLPGHGYSSRLPSGVEYTSSLYLMTILCIQSKLKWPKASLMGHSMGAILCYTYSLMYNHRVDFTICFDAFKPLARPKIRENLANNLEKFLKYNAYVHNSEEPPSYTMDEIKRRVCAPNDNSVAPEYSDFLIERNVAPSKLHPGKYYFSRDLRVKTNVPNIFTQEEKLEDAQHLKTPIFIAKCTDSSYYGPKENLYEVLEVVKRSSPACEYHYVKGKHHAHLCNPERMSDLVNSFITRHNTEDRSIGGIQDDIIIQHSYKRSFAT